MEITPRPNSFTSLEEANAYLASIGRPQDALYRYSRGMARPDYFSPSLLDEWGYQTYGADWAPEGSDSGLGGLVNWGSFLPVAAVAVMPIAASYFGGAAGAAEAGAGAATTGAEAGYSATAIPVPGWEAGGISALEGGSTIGGAAAGSAIPEGLSLSAAEMGNAAGIGEGFLMPISEAGAAGAASEPFIINIAGAKSGLAGAAGTGATTLAPITVTGSAAGAGLTAAEMAGLGLGVSAAGYGVANALTGASTAAPVDYSIASAPNATSQPLETQYGSTPTTAASWMDTAGGIYDAAKPFIGPATSLISGAMGSSAAKDAAQTQADAAKYAADLTNSQYQQSRTDMMPWLQAGTGALNALTQRLGRVPTTAPAITARY